MLSIEPTRSNILVRIDQTAKIKSRIVNPADVESADAWKERKPGFLTGIVISVGPGVDYLCPGPSGTELKRIRPLIKANDVVVLINHWNSSEIEIDGDVFRLIDESTVIGTIVRK